MPQELDLVRDVLDEQLLDRDGERMGKADSIVIAIDGDNQPRVLRIECGFAALAGRIHPRLEKICRAIGRRFGVRRGRTIRIGWSKIIGVGIDVTLDLHADDTEALAWERWLYRRIIRNIPTIGGHRDV